MIVIEKLSGTKQCILKKHIKTIDYLLKYIKSDTDICVQERDDDLYTIIELNKINKEGGEE